MTKQLDPFHLQIVSTYFQSPQDFINIIQIKKQFQYLLDRFRINPIPITQNSKNLFQYLDTQQIFKNKSNEIILEIPSIIQYNYTVTYSQMMQMKEENKEKELKFKSIQYTMKDREKYGNKIPSNINLLDNYCFDNSIQEIILPNSIVSIPKQCFYFYKYLSKITLSTNIMELKERTFSHCEKLKHIHLPQYLTKIGNECFYDCTSLEEVVFPESLRIIEEYAFSFCSSLSKIDLRKATQLKKLEKGVFKHCKILNEIYFNETLESIGESCFSECEFHCHSNSTQKYDTIESITIPSSVSFIGKNCFSNCETLKELIILNKNCHIDGSFIEGCKSLTKLKIPTISGYCTYIPTEQEYEILKQNGINVFYYQKNSIIDAFDRDIQFINNEVLDNTIKLYREKYTSIYIPSTVTRINNNFFDGFVSLREINIPKSVVEFGNGNINFKNSHINQIKFEDKRTVIKNQIVEYDEYLFFKKNGIHCENVSISFDCCFKEIPTEYNIVIDGWNYRNGLLKEIPPNIIEFIDLSFLNHSITSLFIPSTVKKCTNAEMLSDHFPNLVELKCYKHHVNCNNHLICDSIELPQLTKIEIVDGTLDDVVVNYQCHLKMKERGIILNNVVYDTIDKDKYGRNYPSVIKSIEYYDQKYDSLKELIQNKIDIRKVSFEIEEFEIPSYQTMIYKGMFNWRIHLTSIKFHNGIKEIGDYAFKQCYALTNILIPSSVTKFGEECFCECSSLTSIDYDKELDGKLIKNCNLLKSIPIIKSLEVGNFERCSYLTSIRLNDSIEKIPVSCFNKCLSLIEITIPSNCSEIDMFAFKYCISLRSIHIPKNVKKINDGAFYGCLNLERIIIENEEIEI